MCRRVWLPPCCEKLGPTESHPHQPCLVLSRVFSQNSECIIYQKHLRCVWDSYTVVAKSYICSLFAVEVITFSLSVCKDWLLHILLCTSSSFLPLSLTHLPKESRQIVPDKGKPFFLRHKMHSLMASTHVWPGNETALQLSINLSVGVFNRRVWPVMTCCLRWSCAFLACKMKLRVPSF